MEASVPATACSRLMTSCMRGLLPITPSKPNFSSSCRFSSRLARLTRTRSDAFSTMARSSAMSTGLVR